MKWIISSSWYNCTLIVSFTNFSCHSRVMCCKTHLNGLTLIECFATYEFPTLLFYLLITRVKIYSQANYPTLKRRSVFWLNENFLHYWTTRIQRIMLMVDSYHSSNVCTVKTAKTILTHWNTSLCRKLSKVVNFPLR